MSFSFFSSFFSFFSFFIIINIITFFIIINIINNIIPSTTSTIGDDGIPQYGSDSLRIPQLSSPVSSLLATTESPSTDQTPSESLSSAHLSAHYWRRRNPPVRIRLPQNPSAQLI